MPLYDFECDSCGDIVRDYQKGMNDRIPKCFICGSDMHILYDQTVIGFKGFTTPGGNGRPGNLEKKLPDGLKDWYKKATSPEYLQARAKKKAGGL